MAQAVLVCSESYSAQREERVESCGRALPIPDTGYSSTNSHFYGEHTSIYSLPRQEHGQGQAEQENLDAHWRGLTPQEQQGLHYHLAYRPFGDGVTVMLPFDKDRGERSPAVAEHELCATENTT